MQKPNNIEDSEIQTFFFTLQQRVTGKYNTMDGNKVMITITTR